MIEIKIIVTMTFMNTLNLKFLSICKAVKILSSKVDNISIPMKEGCYDLIVDAKGVISRIKVLRTAHQSSCGSYVVSVRKGLKKDLFIPSSCEFIFVDCPDFNYLIPCKEITQRTAITMSTFEKYKLIN